MFLRGKPAYVMPQQLVNHKNEFLGLAPVAEQMSLDPARLPAGDAGRLAMSQHKGLPGEAVLCSGWWHRGA